MSDTTRTNTRDESDPWATDSTEAFPAVAEGPKQGESTDLRLARQAIATETAAHAMHQVSAGMRDLNGFLGITTEALTDNLDYVALAETVAWFQDVKRMAAEMEAYVSRELGHADPPQVVELSDGRRAEVLKGKDRKAWRHDDWKRDARQAVAGDLAHAEIVDTESGDVADAGPYVLDLLARIQDVHGAGAPKVTELKALGLSADDYCESYPGPWAVKISTPATTQEK